MAGLSGTTTVLPGDDLWGGDVEGPFNSGSVQGVRARQGSKGQYFKLFRGGPESPRVFMTSINRAIRT